MHGQKNSSIGKYAGRDKAELVQWSQLSCIKVVTSGEDVCTNE